MTFSEITPDDLKELVDLQPDGWPDIIPYYTFYLNAPFCQPMKFLLGDKLVGAGTLILHEKSAWLAHILVHKDFRNRGLGTKITTALVERFEKTGYKTLSLIATPLGLPVYKKLGFIEETLYYGFKREKSPTFQPADSIQDFMSNDFDQLIQLDKSATGENRSSLLRLFLEGGKVYVSDNQIVGFYLPQLMDGLVIARDKKAGLELMKLRLIDKPFAALPKENEAASQFLQDNSYELISTVTRMRIGIPLGFKGDWMYNRIGGNMG